MRKSALAVQILVLFLSTISGPQAFAQIDPSSALLIDSGSRTGARDSGLDSGRYTVRPRGETKKEDLRAPKSDLPSVSATATPVPKAVESSEQVDSNTVASSPPTSEAQAAPLSERRLSILEVSIAPGYLYNSSQSDYAYRNYFTSSPIVTADANVWVGSRFAVHAGYVGTLSASVSDSLEEATHVSISQQWFALGFKGRKFFGNSGLSPSIKYGVDWLDYQFRAAADSALRAKLASSGVQLNFEADVPSSLTHSWTLGVSIAPKLSHAETSNGIDFKSGSSVEANAVTLSLGGRIRFDLASAMFWKFTHRVEKNLFSGDATQADPVTGNTPSGVSVTNSFSGLEIGYTWGH